MAEDLPRSRSDFTRWQTSQIDWELSDEPWIMKPGNDCPRKDAKSAKVRRVEKVPIGVLRDRFY
jgi:hypothetical protein